MTDVVGLKPLALRPLPLGQVRPTGWLRRQLRLQADGLSGHLDEFWPDIARSGWIGGDAEGWERGPYWLDGVVPLAYLLDDDRLKAKVGRWVDYILAHQHADGWFGPRDEGKSRTGHIYDPWPRYPLLKALAQFHEATGDARVLPAITRFLRRLADLLAVEPLRSWGHHRWADLVVVVHCLFDRTGEHWLLDLAAVCHRQGFDWGGFFADLPYRDRCTPEQCTRDSHVVNNAMGVKQPGVWFRQSGDEADRAAVLGSIAALDTYHGQVTGAFTGDEHLAGRNPSQGTELCAIVEYMYSLEVLIGILGDDPALADRLERLAFNCLPATCSGDMWTHQYDQQANQVVCRVADERVYTNNGPDANLFGLEPNFGCCTANLHQGWPKFAAHLWRRTPDDGLAAVAYAPCEVVTTVRGAPVRLTVETDYPFRQTVRITVHAAQPTRFPLRLRVPGWTTPEARVQLDDEAGATLATLLMAGTFFQIDRTWSGSVTITLDLPMPIRVARGFNDSVAVSRGPLVYALRIGEDWRLVRGEHPRADWAIEPTTPWNYALALDPTRPDQSIASTERPVGEQPFSPDGTPVVATVQGRRLPGWTLERNAAAPPPASPVSSTEPLEDLTLIPYGCTNLRVTEFPLLATPDDAP